MADLIDPDAANLIAISSTLLVSKLAYYGKPYRFITRHFMRLVVEPLDRIIAELGLDDRFFFVLKPLRGNRYGLTFPQFELAEIDPRRHSLGEIVATFCHEALHLKQIQDGRLKWEQHTQSLIWDGQPYHSSDLPALSDTTFEQYESLPWEKDVRSKEVDLYRRVTGHELFPNITGKV